MFVYSPIARGVRMTDHRTPLLFASTRDLPRPAGYVVHDHPIFLRACHSPWPWLSQNLLTYIRGFIVAYLSVLLGMLLVSKANRENEHRPLFLLFQFSTASFLLLYMYHVLAFCWTVTHCYWENIDELVDDHWDIRIIRALSPPVQKPNDHKDLYFSLFYTAVHVFALINALVFWAILVPSGHAHLAGMDEVVIWGKIVVLFANGWFESFCIINLYAVTVLLVLVESLFLNGIKRPTPAPGHIYSLMFMLGVYVGWAALGKRLTGHSPFFFLDPDVVGGQAYAAAYSAAFVGLAPIVFALMYGLIAIRETLTRRRR